MRLCQILTLLCLCCLAPLEVEANNARYQTRIVPGSDATLNKGKWGIGIGPGIENSVIYCDEDNHEIKKLDLDTNTETIVLGGSSGDVDGTGTSAEFDKPHSIVYLPTANLWYITDMSNHMIREVTTSWVVTKRAGAARDSDYINGDLGTNRLDEPRGIIASADENTLYFVDGKSRTIRKMDRASAQYPVSLVAGSAGTSGYLDATGPAAEFKDHMHGCAWLNPGVQTKMLVADFGNEVLRLVDVVSGVVTTAACNGAGGTVDGTRLGARCRHPWGVAMYSLAGVEAVYFSQPDDNVVRKISFTKDYLITVAGDGGGSEPPTGLRNGYGLLLSRDQQTLYIMDEKRIVEMDHLEPTATPSVSLSLSQSPSETSSTSDTRSASISGETPSSTASRSSPSTLTASLTQSPSPSDSPSASATATTLSHSKTGASVTSSETPSKSQSPSETLSTSDTRSASISGETPSSAATQSTMATATGKQRPHTESPSVTPRTVSGSRSPTDTPTDTMSTSTTRSQTASATPGEIPTPSNIPDDIHSPSSTLTYSAPTETESLDPTETLDVSASQELTETTRLIPALVVELWPLNAEAFASDHRREQEANQRQASSATRSLGFELQVSTINGSAQLLQLNCGPVGRVATTLKIRHSNNFTSDGLVCAPRYPGLGCTVDRVPHYPAALAMGFEITLPSYYHQNLSVVCEVSANNTTPRLVSKSLLLLQANSTTGTGAAATDTPSTASMVARSIFGESTGCFDPLFYLLCFVILCLIISVCVSACWRQCRDDRYWVLHCDASEEEQTDDNWSPNWRVTLLQHRYIQVFLPCNPDCVVSHTFLLCSQVMVLFFLAVCTSVLFYSKSIAPGYQYAAAALALLLSCGMNPLMSFFYSRSTPLELSRNDGDEARTNSERNTVPEPATIDIEATPPQATDGSSDVEGLSAQQDQVDLIRNMKNCISPASGTSSPGLNTSSPGNSRSNNGSFDFRGKNFSTNGSFDLRNNGSFDLRGKNFSNNGSFDLRGRNPSKNGSFDFRNFDFTRGNNGSFGNGTMTRVTSVSTFHLMDNITLDLDDSDDGEIKEEEVHGDVMKDGDVEMDVDFTLEGGSLHAPPKLGGCATKSLTAIPKSPKNQLTASGPKVSPLAKFAHSSNSPSKLGQSIGSAFGGSQAPTPTFLCASTPPQCPPTPTSQSLGQPTPNSQFLCPSTPNAQFLTPPTPNAQFLGQPPPLSQFGPLSHPPATNAQSATPNSFLGSFTPNSQFLGQSFGGSFAGPGGTISKLHLSHADTEDDQENTLKLDGATPGGKSPDKEKEEEEEDSPVQSQTLQQPRDTTQYILQGLGAGPDAKEVVGEYEANTSEVVRVILLQRRYRAYGHMVNSSAIVLCAICSWLLLTPFLAGESTTTTVTLSSSTTQHLGNIGGCNFFLGTMWKIFVFDVVLVQPLIAVLCLAYRWLTSDDTHSEDDLSDQAQTMEWLRNQVMSLTNDVKDLKKQLAEKK